MALALKRIRGRDLTFAITGGGTITAIRDLKIDAKTSTMDVSAATATFDQKVIGRSSITGSYTLWLGTEGVAPAIGDEITALSASVSSDEVTPTNVDDATVYGKLRVTSVSHAFQADPATVSVGFEGGFLS